MDNKFPQGNPDQESRPEMLKQLRDGFYNDEPCLHVSSRFLSTWQNYSHPLLGLLYYKKRTWQAASKGITPGPVLALLLGLIGNAVRITFNAHMDGTLVKQVVKILQGLKCDLNCLEWLRTLLEFDNFGKWVAQVTIAYFATLVVVIGLAYLLGYIAGRFSLGRENIGLSLNGLYHDYPYGQRYSSWSQFCAVRWLGMDVKNRGGIVQWFMGCFPIRLLLSDGGSIRIWGPRADREWLTEVMELLIAHHHKELKGKLPVWRTKQEAT